MQNMVDLKKLSSCHAFAARALDIMRFLGYKWKVDSIFGKMGSGRNAQNFSQDSLVAMDLLRPITGDIAVLNSREAQLFAIVAVPLQRRPLLVTGK